MSLLQVLRSPSPFTRCQARQPPFHVQTCCCRLGGTAPPARPVFACQAQPKQQRRGIGRASAPTAVALALVAPGANCGGEVWRSPQLELPISKRKT